MSKLPANTVLHKMEHLHKLPWKEQQAVLDARAKMVRVHSGPEFHKPGARLKFTRGTYVRQANGSLVKVWA